MEGKSQNLKEDGNGSCSPSPSSLILSMSLQTDWYQLSQDFHVPPKMQASLWREISTAHSEPHRYYHTLQHLERLMTHFKAVEDKIKEPEVVLFSIFYHDIVYSVTDPAENEKASAEIAVKRLSEIGLAEEPLQKIKSLILATKHHGAPSSPVALDWEYFMDFDLEILGASPETYETYAKNIRLEYSIYSDEEYRKGRTVGLQKLLDLGANLYRTEEFNTRYLSQAQENIKKELTAISGQ